MVGKLRQFTALYSNGGHVKTYAPGDSLIGRQNTETNWQEKIVRKTKAKLKKNRYRRIILLILLVLSFDAAKKLYITSYGDGHLKKSGFKV